MCNCGRKFETQRSLNSHARFCELYIKKQKQKPKSKYKDIYGNYTCECGKVYTYYQSFNAHLSHCDIHHDKVGTVRKKRPNELYHTMNWDNKSDSDIKEIRKKASKTYSQRQAAGIFKHPFAGKKHSIETRRNIRLSTLKYIASTTKDGKLSPRYNKRAISYIDQLNITNNWNLQHAENGGEISVDGYWLDGYDKDLNIAFEYDEPRHYIDKENSILCQRDIDRQNYIINKLHCKFYRYNEYKDYFYEIIL